MLDKGITKNQAMYLLWITIMNQSQRPKDVLKNANILWDKLDDKDIFLLSNSDIKNIFLSPKKLHRFPNAMSYNIYECIQKVKKDYYQDATLVFENDIITNLISFSGIGIHKAKICFFVYSMLVSNSTSIHNTCIDGCTMLPEDIIDELLSIKSIK